MANKTISDFAIISKGIIEKIYGRFYYPNYSKKFLRSIKRFLKQRMQVLPGSFIYDDGKFISSNNLNIRFTGNSIVFQNGNKSVSVTDCPAIIDITDYVRHILPCDRYKYKAVLNAILWFGGVIIYNHNKIATEKDLSAIIGH